MSSGVPSPRGIVARQSCLLSCQASFSVCCWQLLLSDELLLVGQMDSFYAGCLLSSLLCHWLVGRAGRRGLLGVVPLPGGRFLCLEVDREGGSERVVSCGG